MRIPVGEAVTDVLVDVGVNVEGEGRSSWEVEDVEGVMRMAARAWCPRCDRAVAATRRSKVDGRSMRISQSRFVVSSTSRGVCGLWEVTDVVICVQGKGD